MKIEQKIESILFFKGEPVGIKKLVDILGVPENDIQEAIKRLAQSLESRGIRVLQKEMEVMLGSAPEAGEIIEELIKEELSKDLGKAGLETLSIVLYLGPITRSRIDYIRGVNSNFILRNLMVRGLVEKTPNLEDQRSFLYKPTFELLSHLGVSRIENIPGYNNVRQEILNFEENSKEEEKENEDV